MSLRILRYVSDLHLEFRSNIDHPKLKPLWNLDSSKDELYLALLGDIGNPYHDTLKLFLDSVSPKYRSIFYVPGNHEYYNDRVLPGRSKNDFDLKLEKLCHRYDNVILMNNSVYNLDGIKIIGSTLWSNIPEEHSYLTSRINDYCLIKKTDHESLIPIDINDTNLWNKQSVDFIEKEIKDASDPCIVLTHHAPLFSNSKTGQYTANPSYLHSENNHAFHNDLSHLMKKPVCAWIYGHTHYTSRFKYNDVIVTTNQLGYRYEDTKFNPYVYLDLNQIFMDWL